MLIFTEFADTARYLKRQLDEAGIDGVAQVDSATKAQRADVIQRFSPYYNGTPRPALAEKGRSEIRVLISTDVLSEGLNLQDASRMINYDIHWNPVRLMQRIGRVDRRMNPEVEKRLVADHPEVASSRGKVSFWNFLPPDELNAILTLYTKVTQKTLLISKTLGIEGKKLLTPEDDYEALKEFNHAYEGTKTAVEDMHLEYQALLQADPELEARLKRLPGAIFSGRKRPAKGARGVFFCYALPALDKEAGEFTEEAGTTRWYLYDLDRDAILEEPARSSPASAPSPKRRASAPPRRRPSSSSAAKVEKHIKNTYLKRVDAPVGRQAGAQVLDGTQRGLSRCRPTTAPHLRRSRRFDQLDRLPARRDGLANRRLRGLRRPDLRLHARGARHRREERRQDPGDQAPAPAVAEPALGHLLRQVRAEEAPRRRAAPHPEPGGAQEARLRQQRRARRLGRGRPALHLQLRRGRRAPDQLRPLLPGRRTATTCRPSRCSAGTTSTRRCTSTPSPTS